MLIRKQNFPIIALILINIVFSLFIFQDFGESWDEQSVHIYAETSLNAYKSIVNHARLENYYGEDILRYYGPAFPIIVKLAISPFNFRGNKEVIDIWHLMNFFCFQLGLYFFYKICLRYMSKSVAFGCTLLFNTQPLLWGHAFINPRDIPFMVFFLGAISGGLSLSDIFPSLIKNKINKTGENIFAVLQKSVFEDWNKGFHEGRVSNLVIIGLIVFIIIFRLTHLAEPIVSEIINRLYFSKDNSLFSRLFSQIAQNANKIPVEIYFNKAITLLNSIEIVLVFLLILLLSLICLNFLRKTKSQIFERYIGATIHNLHVLAVNRLQNVQNHLRKLVVNPRATLISFIKEFKSSLFYLQNWQFWTAAILLGLCISTRIIGPFAGLLVSVIILIKTRMKSLNVILGYFAIAFIVVYISWPFLWGDPINRLIESTSVMSKFPWDERLLFNGEYFKSDALPTSYFPVLLSVQLTEPAILLIIVGFITAIFQYFKNKITRSEILILFGWFFIPFIAIELLKAPMYDNFRHSLYIVPPLFIFAGFSLQAIFQKVKPTIFTLVVIVMLIPGIYNIITLHPYSYVYYNYLVGGVKGANGHFEMDYYGTSLKETTEYLNTIANKNAKILVAAPINIVESYARKDLILESVANSKNIPVYDYLIYLNRFTWPRYLSDQPEIYHVEREGSIFSAIRKIENK